MVGDRGRARTLVGKGGVLDTISWFRLSLSHDDGTGRIRACRRSAPLAAAARPVKAMSATKRRCRQKIACQRCHLLCMTHSPLDAARLEIQKANRSPIPAAKRKSLHEISVPVTSKQIVGQTRLIRPVFVLRIGWAQRPNPLKTQTERRRKPPIHRPDATRTDLRDWHFRHIT